MDGVVFDVHFELEFFFQEGFEGLVLFCWEGEKVLFVVVFAFASSVAFSYGFRLYFHQD